LLIRPPKIESLTLKKGEPRSISPSVFALSERRAGTAGSPWRSTFDLFAGVVDDPPSLRIDSASS
jgi:hypothetical protein